MFSPLVRLRYQRLLVALLVLLAASRFVHLSADFPNAFGVRGVLYTDEGWWARNAVAWVRTGNWSTGDGYDPVINLPVQTVLQWVWFNLWGISLASARALSALCSVCIAGVLYLICRREMPVGIALLAPFFVLSNFAIFAFGRLALLEMPMLLLMLLSLWLAMKTSKMATSVTEMFVLVGSAALLTAAILTKTTALFGLPLIAFVVFMQPKSWVDKVRCLLTWLLAVGVLYALYYVMVVQPNSVSHEYFAAYNVTGKLRHDSLISLLRKPLRAIKRSLQLYPIFFPAAVGAVAFLFSSKQQRHSHLFHVATLWGILSLGIFSVSNYAAPRYFVVLIVPMAMLFPMVVQEMALRQWRPISGLAGRGARRRRGRAGWLGTCLAGAIALSSIISLGRMGLYLSQPQFSLQQMAHQIARDIQTSPQQPVAMLGRFVDTLALEVPIVPVNDKMGYRSMDYRLRELAPEYYLSMGDFEQLETLDEVEYERSPQLEAILSAQYSLIPVDRFDVFENRIYDRPVFLYRLRSTQAAGE